MRRVGVHTSIAGGLHLSLKRAGDLGCTTMQIFAHNPRSWKTRKIADKEIEQFRKLANVLNIRPIFIHSSYLINFASPDSEIRKKSLNLLSYELKMSQVLGVDYVVLHPGKAAGQDIRTAIKRASEALSIAYEKANGNVGVLLENTAGQKGDISSTIPMLSDIISRAVGSCVKGICLDTCHAYAAGYDITSIEGLRNLKEEIVRYLSPLSVELIHINDSRKGLSSGVDRHQHIGKGHIGLKGFRQFLSFPFFEAVPLILETPVDTERDDMRNLQQVRRILKKAKGI